MLVLIGRCLSTVYFVRGCRAAKNCNKKKVSWSDEPRFLLHHVEVITGCTMVRKQADEGSVWVIFCWETFDHALHVDVTSTCITYLNIREDHIPNHKYQYFTSTHRIQENRWLEDIHVTWGAMRKPGTGFHNSAFRLVKKQVLHYFAVMQNSGRFF